MKLNKKGFTLIELLAVVVIMLAISVMAVSSISAAIKRNAKKQDEAKQKVLATYGELYYQKYKNSLSISGSGCIYVDSLSEYTSEDNSSGEQEEETEEDIEENNMEQIQMINSFKRKTFENIEKFQWLRRFWIFISDRYFIFFKNKIRNLLLNIEKNLKEKEN